jgi:hypothetical protein
VLQLNVQHKRRPLRPCGVRAYLNAGGLVHQGVVRGEVRVHQGHAVPLIHLRVQLGPLAHRGGAAPPRGSPPPPPRRAIGWFNTMATESSQSRTESVERGPLITPLVPKKMTAASPDPAQSTIELGLAIARLVKPFTYLSLPPSEAHFRPF